MSQTTESLYRFEWSRTATRGRQRRPTMMKVKMNRILLATATTITKPTTTLASASFSSLSSATIAAGISRRYHHHRSTFVVSAAHRYHHSIDTRRSSSSSSFAIAAATRILGIPSQTTILHSSLNNSNHQRMQSSSSSSSSSSSYKLPSWSQVEAALTKAKFKKLEGQNVELAIMALLQADAVCFDVDSTVITEEGIDVLADYLGKGPQVKELTKRAMEGSNLTFDKALQMRLDLLQPNRNQIMALLQERPLELTKGVADFMDILQERGVDVYLVSGGFRIMIEPIAKKLCIARDRIIANTLLFDETTGAYIGFDTNEPTSADMGKPKALQQIKDQHYNYDDHNATTTMIMIGDGATDAQAKPPAQAFIGFGGVVVREPVKQVADVFVTSFEPLTLLMKQFGRNKLSSN